MSYDPSKDLFHDTNTSAVAPACDCVLVAPSDDDDIEPIRRRCGSTSRRRWPTVSGP